MPKLHELLAVQSNQSTQAEKMRSDLMKTFGAKRHLFEEKVVTFKPNTEGATATTESQSDIQTTVSGELAWVSAMMSKSIDTAFQIDVANTQAKGDIVTEDGLTVAEGVPATSLLQLEKRIAEFQALLTVVPTLDPAKGFSVDEARGKGYYQARPINKTRTKKIKKALTMAPATDKHPAQVQLIEEDEPVGTISEQEWSTLLTPSTKAVLLERCENLLRAVKKARSRANDIPVELDNNKIGKKLLDYVLWPIA